jgi:hypothetical protein
MESTAKANFGGLFFYFWLVFMGIVLILSAALA